MRSSSSPPKPGSTTTSNFTAIVFPLMSIGLRAIMPSLPGAMRQGQRCWVDFNWLGGCAAAALAIRHQLDSTKAEPVFGVVEANRLPTFGQRFHQMVKHIIVEISNKPRHSSNRYKLGSDH